MELDLSKIKIREIKENEIDLLVKYRLVYLAELQGEQTAEYRDRLTVELNAYFKAAMAEKRFVGYLAEIDGQALSFGGMVVKTIPGDFVNPKCIEADILNMYTIPAARKKGISALVLQQLINEARERNICKLTLHTSPDGEKLYRKFGFAEAIYPVLEQYI